MHLRTDPLQTLDVPDTADVALVLRSRLIGWTYEIRPIATGTRGVGPHWRATRTAAIAAGSWAAIACAPREPWITVSAPVVEHNGDLIAETVDTFRNTADRAGHTPELMHVAWPEIAKPRRRLPLPARALAAILRQATR